MSDLIERLLNPMWAHSNAPFESPQLEQEDNLATMREAAAEIARLEADIKVKARLLNNQRDEIKRLTGLVEGVRAKTIEECARAVDDHLQPGHGCVSQAAAVVLKLLHPSTERTGGEQ